MAEQSTARAIQLLQENALRKTNMRIDVLNIFLDHSETALSSQELENNLGNSDRVTLYRTLKTFEKKGIIHQAIDGSGVTKYAICQSDCTEHQHVDDHAHFHCNDCGKTLCLEQISTPKIDLPSGYEASANYIVIQGTCSQCNS